MSGKGALTQVQDARLCISASRHNRGSAGLLFRDMMQDVVIKNAPEKSAREARKYMTGFDHMFGFPLVTLGCAEGDTSRSSGFCGLLSVVRRGWPNPPAHRTSDYFTCK